MHEFGAGFTAYEIEDRHLSYRDGKLQSLDCAVITLPLGVLQQAPDLPDAVEFSPELPEKRSAWSRLRMGDVIKVVLRFHEPFWERLGHRDLAFLHAPAERIVTWWTTWPMQSSTLTGWSGGAQVESLRGMDETAILGAARPWALRCSMPIIWATTICW